MNKALLSFCSNLKRVWKKILIFCFICVTLCILFYSLSLAQGIKNQINSYASGTKIKEKFYRFGYFSRFHERTKDEFQKRGKFLTEEFRSSMCLGLIHQMLHLPTVYEYVNIEKNEKVFVKIERVHYVYLIGHDSFRYRTPEEAFFCETIDPVSLNVKYPNKFKTYNFSMYDSEGYKGKQYLRKSSKFVKDMGLDDLDFLVRVELDDIIPNGFEVETIKQFETFEKTRRRECHHLYQWPDVKFMWIFDKNENENEIAVLNKVYDWVPTLLTTSNVNHNFIFIPDAVSHLSILSENEKFASDNNICFFYKRMKSDLRAGVIKRPNSCTISHINEAYEKEREMRERQYSKMSLMEIDEKYKTNYYLGMKFLRMKESN